MSKFDLETMGFPIPGLEFPFSGLALTGTPYETIYATHGIIFKLDRRIVLKVPVLHNMRHHIDSCLDEAIASHKAQKREKRAYEFLQHHPHPNILQCLITVPEGLFLERAAMSIWDRMTKFANHDIKWGLKLRWAGEIAAAAAWIENLGFVHGEIRPTNVLLTADTWHVKLVGSDKSQKINRPMPTVKMPYWVDKEHMHRAGAATEQFAFASTLFFIEKGYEAVFELTNLGVFVAFPEFAPYAWPFAGIVRKGWERGFENMATLAREISSETLRRRAWALDVCGLVRTVHGNVEYYFDPNKGIIPQKMLEKLVEDCEEWMKIHKKDPAAEAAERLRKRLSEAEMRASF